MSCTLLRSLIIYIPVAALLKRKRDDLKVFVSSVHVSPSSFSVTTTPAKNRAATPARIRGQKETMQARIYSDVTEIHVFSTETNESMK